MPHPQRSRGFLGAVHTGKPKSSPGEVAQNVGKLNVVEVTGEEPGLAPQCQTSAQPYFSLALTSRQSANSQRRPRPASF